PGREDADARSGDRVGGVGAAFGGEVADAGRRIIVLEITIAAAWRSEAAREAIEVGHSRDREDLVVVRWHVRGEVLAAVPGRDNVRDTGRDRVADRAMERVAVGVATVAVVRARPAQAHVGDLDAERRRVRRDPVDATDDLRVGTAALRVDDLDRVKLRSRRDTDDPGTVVLRADRARDVSAMTVVVTGVSAADAVLSVHRVQVRVREIDPRVDDGDVRGRGLTHRGRGRRAETPHARRRGVTGLDRYNPDRVQNAVG